MAFKLRSIAQLLGINEEASEYGMPVFEKKLDPNIQGEANRDGTIFVKKGLPQKQINEIVEHEKIHLQQMGQGRLDYNNETVTWKPNTKTPARVYQRANMLEGAKNLPWEKEAYNKTKK